MKKNQSLDNYLPELKQPLNKNNYEKRFHSLLYIDEYENQQNLKNFEMKRVRFQRDGPFLSIFVPGLSDGRPNLIIGGRVMVINEMTFDGKVFNGTIEEVNTSL